MYTITIYAQGHQPMNSSLVVKVKGEYWKIWKSISYLPILSFLRATIQGANKMTYWWQRPTFLPTTMCKLFTLSFKELGKGKVHPKLRIHPFTTHTMPMEALVISWSTTNCFGVSRKERITPNGRHALECKQTRRKEEKHKLSPYCSCCVIQTGSKTSNLSPNTMFLAKIYTIASPMGAVSMLALTSVVSSGCMLSTWHTEHRGELSL